MRTLKNHYAGVLLAGGVALLSILLQGTALFSRTLAVSPLIIAILLGFAVNNIFRLPSSIRPGIKFTAKRVLRLAIILLGFRLSLGDVIGIGAPAIMVISVSTVTTLLFTMYLGLRMGIPLKRALLLGSGVSVCGASAVAAVDGVIAGKEEDAAFAIGAVTLFGTAFMFIYPAIFSFFRIDPVGYAIWAGSSVHEVAQVAAAGSALAGSSNEALASTVKMIRVLFILPITMILAFLPLGGNAGGTRDTAGEEKKIQVPWFAILFFFMVCAHTWAFIPARVTGTIVRVDGWLMTAAMAGLGLDIALSSILKIGRRALLLGLVSSLFISLLSAVMVFAVIR